MESCNMSKGGPARYPGAQKHSTSRELIISGAAALCHQGSSLSYHWVIVVARAGHAQGNIADAHGVHEYLEVIEIPKAVRRKKIRKCNL